MLSFYLKSQDYIFKKMWHASLLLRGSAQVFKLPFIEVAPSAGDHGHYK